MANTRELRRRIKSVKNTAQITKAMQMVAATKMRRAQNQAFSGRPYSLTLNQALSQLLPKIEAGLHPLLGSPNPEQLNHPHGNDKEGKTGVILLSTDKGLAGALNTNLFRATLQFMNKGIASSTSSPRNDVFASAAKQSQNIEFFTQGKKARQFVVKLNKTLIADFENPDTVNFRQATQISKVVVDSFLKKELKEVFLIYPDFISTLRQDPKILKLLPLDPTVIAGEVKQSLTNRHPELVSGSQNKIAASTSSPRNDASAILLRNDDKSEVVIEPNVDELLDYVLLHFIQTKIYQALLETKASEHSARMMAMQNATDNAKELVGDLTLAYNQTRQEGITNELLEITSALAALE